MNLPEPKHAYPPGERIARLEVQVEQIGRDVAAIKKDMRPVSDAFSQAKGARAVIIAVGSTLMFSLGLITNWLVSWVGWVHPK